MVEVGVDVDSPGFVLEEGEVVDEVHVGGLQWGLYSVVELQDEAGDLGQGELFVVESEEDAVADFAEGFGEVVEVNRDQSVVLLDAHCNALL